MREEALLNIGTIVQAAQQHDRDELFVLLGFDGVLAEYEDDPGAVRLSDRQHDALRRLLAAPGVALGIVSGRRVADLTARVGLGDALFYIGLHGLEVTGPAGFAYHPRARLDDYRAPLRELAADLQRSIGDIEGARLEDKDGTIALHTRGAASSDAVWCRLHMLNRAAHLVNTGKFRIVRGSHVFELVPSAGPARAAAITALVGGGPSASALATTDDVEHLVAQLAALPRGTAEAGECLPPARI